MTEKKQRKPRQQKTAELYLPQLRKLSLAEKVKLCKILREDIAAEVKTAEEVATTAKETVNGL